MEEVFSLETRDSYLVKKGSYEVRFLKVRLQEVYFTTNLPIHNRKVSKL